MTRPTLMVFDLDDTLYEYGPCHAAGTAAWTAYAERELNVPPKAWREAIRDARHEVKSSLGSVAASHSRLLYAATAVRRLGFGVNPSLTLALEQEYWRAYLLRAELRPGALDLIAALRYNGIPIAIITDLTMQIQLRKLIRLELDSLVDHLLCSEETRAEKPELVPFERLLSGLSPDLRESVWFVGDGAQDVPLARLRNAGLITEARGFLLGNAVPESDPDIEMITGLDAVESRLLEAL